MAQTSVGAFGKLQINYTGGRLAHVFQVYVPHFLADVGVGTFTAGGTPASLADLADELAEVIKPLFTSDTGVSFGSWRGLEYLTGTDNNFLPIVSGDISAPAASYGTGTNPAKDVSQVTYTARAGSGKLSKFTLFGAHYLGPDLLPYSALGGGFKDFIDYITGSTRILARDGGVIASLVDLSFDTNDEVTRKYRR